MIGNLRSFINARNRKATKDVGDEDKSIKETLAMETDGAEQARKAQGSCKSTEGSEYNDDDDSASIMGIEIGVPRQIQTTLLSGYYSCYDSSEDLQASFIVDETQPMSLGEKNRLHGASRDELSSHSVTSTPKLRMRRRRPPSRPKKIDSKAARISTLAIASRSVIPCPSMSSDVVSWEGEEQSNYSVATPRSARSRLSRGGRRAIRRASMSSANSTLSAASSLDNCWEKAHISANHDT